MFFHKPQPCFQIRVLRHLPVIIIRIPILGRKYVIRVKTKGSDLSSGTTAQKWRRLLIKFRAKRVVQTCELICLKMLSSCNE